MINNKRFTALIVIGLALAVAIPLATAYLSNAWVVTIKPTPTIAVTSNSTSYFNGDTIALTATLATIPDGTVVTFRQDNVAIGTATTAGGVATLNTPAVNTGTVDKTSTFTADTP